MNQGDHQASRIAARKSAELAREINDQPMLAQALASLGIGELYSGNPEAALAVTQESIAISKKLGLKLELMWGINTMTHIHDVNSDEAQLQKYKDDMQNLEREAGVPINPAATERELSMKLFLQGNLPEALEHVGKSLALYEEQNDKYALTFFVSEVAHALRQSGNLDKALHYYRKSILLWQDFGHRAAVAHQLECFAFIAVEHRQFSRAIKLFGAAETLREISNSVRTPAEQKEFEGAKSQLQAGMEEIEFNEVWKEGQMMTMEQAIEFALEENG